jgi:hypothetical protein
MSYLEEYLADEKLVYHIFEGIITISDMKLVEQNLVNELNNYETNKLDNKGIGTLIIEEFNLGPNEILNYKFPSFIDIVSDIKCSKPLLWKLNKEQCRSCMNKNINFNNFNIFDQCYDCLEDMETKSYIKLFYNDEDSTFIIHNNRYMNVNILLSYVGYKLTNNERKRLLNEEIIYYPYIYNKSYRRIIV